MPTKVRGQKATTLLREDHRNVRRLFDEFESLEHGEEARMMEIFETVRRELQIHAQIEEEIFYPAMERIEDEDTKELVLEAYEEHAIVRTLLEELSGLTTDDDAFRAKMKVLAENVRHHAGEEESELFPAFDELPREEQAEIAERLRARKAEIELA